MHILKIGDTGRTLYGTEYVLVGFTEKNKPIIEFQDEMKVRKDVYPTNFRSGNVRNPYDVTIYGHGYLGLGPYKTTERGRGVSTYNVWRNIFIRCYWKPDHKKHPTYAVCSVDPVWHNYQNFAKWWEDNRYVVPGERMDFDKDILVKGNKVYSPDTCCIIPHRINLLFVTRKSQRNGTPVGVQRHGDRYYATCGIESGIVERLGSFDTEMDAFLAYKTRKEKNIREVADRYKKWIPKNVYDALYNWVVEIDD